jgi:hypothetical protein
MNDRGEAMSSTGLSAPKTVGPSVQHTYTRWPRPIWDRSWFPAAGLRARKCGQRAALTAAVEIGA